MTGEMRFRSAVGWCFKAPALLVVTLLIRSQWNGLNVVAVVVLGLSLALIWWLYATTAYTITAEGLRVESGPVHVWADAARIERVRPTKTILAGPALSLDRLEVSGSFGAVVISPADKTAFVRALKNVAPQVRLEGDLQNY